MIIIKTAAKDTTVLCYSPRTMILCSNLFKLVKYPSIYLRVEYSNATVDPSIESKIQSTFGEFVYCFNDVMKLRMRRLMRHSINLNVK